MRGILMPIEYDCLEMDSWVMSNKSICMSYVLLFPARKIREQGKAAFLPRCGLLEDVVMSLRLSNAPGTFQFHINEILRDSRKS